MERDGFNKSLWQKGILAYEPKKTGAGEQVYDVVVVGGGITGVTTAYELQRAGQKCLIVEAHTLCYGTTGGTTAHLNNFFDKTYADAASDFGKEEAATLAQAANDALEMYRRNLKTLNIPCDYAEVDGVLFALDEKQAEQLDEIYSASREAGIDVSYTESIPVPIPFVKAISFAGQGQFHPAKYIYGLANAFEQAGGVILEHCRVEDVEEKEDILFIRSGTGVLKAKKLVYATHIPPGVNLLHLRCAPYRSYAMAIELADGQYPTAASYDLMDPYHYYRTQETDGKKYLIAGGEDHKTGHEENTEAPFERLEAYLRKYFNNMEVKFKWSAQYFEPADGLAYIGHLPGASENIFVATGFSGNGMTFSQIAARVLTSLITTGVPAYNNLFSPDRVKPFAGFSAFIKENAAVVSDFIGDRLNQPTLDSLNGLKNGAGEVVKYEHQSLAVYKDDQGRISAVHPVCTHLKCTVKWNQTERSWDCPCHGARYSVSGEVITGPSVKDLKTVDLKPAENEAVSGMRS